MYKIIQLGGDVNLLGGHVGLIHDAVEQRPSL